MCWWNIRKSCEDTVTRLWDKKTLWSFIGIEFSTGSILVYVLWDRPSILRLLYETIHFKYTKWDRQYCLHCQPFHGARRKENFITSMQNPSFHRISRFFMQNHSFSSKSTFFPILHTFMEERWHLKIYKPVQYSTVLYTTK
jgi:hypothetical protein